MKQVRKNNVRERRRTARTRARIRGNEKNPRLSVFRSERYISAQLIDDVRGVTLTSASDRELQKTKKKSSPPLRPCDRAKWVGEQIAERAKTKGVGEARFDRGKYRYHGRVAAVAEGARKGGLKL